MMSMKKNLVISIVAPAVVAGALVGGVVMSQKDKPFNPVAAEKVSEQVPIDVPVKFIAESAFGEIMEPSSVVVESRTTVTSTDEAGDTTDPLVQSEQQKEQEMMAYIRANAPIHQFNQCVNSFYRSKEAFYTNREAALAICLEVLNERTIINKNAEILKRLAAL